MKRRHPDLQGALEAVHVHHHDVEARRSNLVESAALRAEAIRDALSKGATLRELAAVMGVTAEGVRQMATRG